MQEKTRQKAADAEDAVGREDALGEDEPLDQQDPTCPTEEEIEAWARAERKRRQAWLAGPTEAEKRTWARRERFRRGDTDPDVDRVSRRFYREMELASVGLVYALARAPFETYVRLVRMGGEWEEGFSRPLRPQRVPFEDI